MRDLGVFEETMDIMSQHGRDPMELTYGEPMLQYRAQGQVLGAERVGDYLRITAKTDEDGRSYQ
jgi:hypothetical protein